jgi:hypothetical protein
MLKLLRLPLCGFIAAIALLAAAPTSRASLSESLLKKIYAQSADGDAGDIYRIIKRGLEDHPDASGDFVRKLIGKLEDNLDSLDNGVSKKDMERVYKRLRKYLKQRQAAQFASSGSHGNIASPESGTANN